ncbi:hypothetical protein LSH36_314g03052 [Paralvinella palmiformis]|uniref:PHD-type domain-containing protein n=1 Tax=Paralvinella palmiformis TaxID=53620 RepID=A0AAD9JHN8_9ANNE|nr:hypothetical protein LSH36_314g03052 [Paralvinella palmiformis]
MGHTPASRQKNSIQSQSDDVWEEEKYDNVSNSEQGELVAGIDDGLYDNENKNDTCPDCKEVADHQDRSLQCEIYTYWFHIKCQKVSEKMYEALNEEDGSDQFSWNCKYCKRGAKALMGHITTIDAKQIKTEKRLTMVERKVKCLEDSIGEMKITDELKDFIDSKIEEGISAYRERELRKTNIIIHNLPEADIASPEDRKQEDEQNIMIMARKIKVPDVDIKSIIRLGEKKQKPRLMKVELSTVSQKRAMLQNAKLLTECEEDSMKKMYTNADLSMISRQQNKVLGQRLTDRVARGEKDLVIRRCKIIQLSSRTAEDHEEKTANKMVQPFQENKHNEQV